MSHPAVAPDDAALRQILAGATTIAVVGIKDDPAEVACQIPTYLRDRGYQVLPVSPKLARWQGQPAFADLLMIGRPIDIVNLFRAPANLAPHIDEILALKPRPRLVWMQLGIRSPEAVRRLAAAGIPVVEDRCIMVDHQRLIAVD